MVRQQGRGAAPFASQFGLVRPLQGRYVAGVCGALGRATRTDPVLWRVVLAVLICFMGTGVVLYLVGWLLIPEEGDTASPLEAMLGRGHSSTSPVLVVVLGIVAALVLVLVLPRPLYVVLGGGAVLAILLLINRVRLAETARLGTRAAAPAPPAPAEPATAPEDATPPAAASPPGTASPPGFPAVPWPATAPAAGTPTDVPTPPGLAEPSGYRPPFAPHGPFATPPLPPPPAPKPPREHSALPGLTFFTTLVVVGVLGVLDLTRVLDIPVAGYLAAALAVVGGGLLVGAWLGRARRLIVLGLVLALAVPVAHGIESVDPQGDVGDLTWTPRSPAEVADEYALRFGSGFLDLRNVDLAGQRTEITVRITFGEMEVVVPPDVAVEATVHSQFGDAQVFGQSRDGITDGVVHDPGSGDPADGLLLLDLHVRLGDLEVRR